jgi:tryptophan synthase alpha chain
MATETGRIARCFAALRDRGEKALIPFLTAGDPDVETTEALVLAMAEAGADIIELGIPFSDPTAEGPTIQRSSARALQAGTSLSTILELVGRLRETIDTPLVLMGYANPIHAMGAKKFAERASNAGVDGVIIPDLTPEEGAPYLSPIREAGINAILLAAPTTPAGRLEMLANETQGFLYYVSLQGVTGARAALSEGIEAKVRLAQSLGDQPVCVGFGVATAAHVAQVGGFADGVVVGSAIVDQVEAAYQQATDSVSGRQAAVAALGSFIRGLKDPLRSTR